MYVCMFRGGFPHALWPLCGLLYVPCEFQTSRHAISPWWHRSPHPPENGGTITLAEELTTMYLDGICPQFLLRGPLGTWGSLTCSKSTTLVKRLKVPPGGLRSLNSSAPPGLNPRHSGHEVGPLPLDQGGRWCFKYLQYIASDNRMTDKQWIWKGLEGSDMSPNKGRPSTSGLGKTMKRWAKIASFSLLAWHTVRLWSVYRSTRRQTQKTVFLIVRPVRTSNPTF
jgi:hypothetical protein